jgi:hypothetical protein
MPSVPHQVEGIPRKRQHMGRCHRHSRSRSNQAISQTPSPSEEKRATPLPPPFITIPSPYSYHYHPEPASIPLPLSLLPSKYAVPIDYTPSTEFFRSLFRLHLWSTNKFHEFNPCWKHHYTTFQHSLLHWYYCEEERCIYHDK